jgi:TrmH family RNA methyltransferase
MTETITSLQNQRIKDAVKLRDRRGRQKQQRIIIDGTREIRRALAAQIAWEEAFVCHTRLRSGDEEVVGMLRAAGAEVCSVSPAVFDKLAFGERAEGIVAIAQTPQRSLAAIELPTSPLVAVVETVEKPGNVGAIMRTADAAGVSAVLVADAGTDLFNPNALRASQGAIFSLSIAAASSAEIRQWLRANELAIYAARVDGAIDYRAADFRGPAAIVLGSEAEGLSDAWRASDITGVRLPMHGVVDSLNVSVTAGVLFYEALRQRSL